MGFGAGAKGKAQHGSRRRAAMDRAISEGVRICPEPGATMQVLDRCYTCDPYYEWRATSCGSTLNGLGGSTRTCRLVCDKPKKKRRR